MLDKTAGTLGALQQRIDDVRGGAAVVRLPAEDPAPLERDAR
jgi:hypothetical protein